MRVHWRVRTNERICQIIRGLDVGSAHMELTRIKLDCVVQSVSVIIPSRYGRVYNQVRIYSCRQIIDWLLLCDGSRARVNVDVGVYSWILKNV